MKLPSLAPAALVLCGLAFVPGCGPNVPEPPNVLLILADDLGVMDVGAYNADTLYRTPNLDELAARGARFTDAYAASPVCSPTRYSILTGRYPTRAGVTNWLSGNPSFRFRGAELHDRMPLDEVTLAEALRDAGYATFFAGKWHLGPTEESWPERQGFDINRGGHALGGPYGPGRYFTPYGNPRLEDGPDGEHLTDRLARETARFIAEPRERPFFAMLSFYSVHTPLMAPEPLVEAWRARVAALEAEAPEFLTEEQVWPGDQERRVRVRQTHAVYAAMVESMDRAVGLVLEAVARAGLDRRTLVVFTSDNGGLATSEGHPTANLPFRGGKGWLYEGGIREPMIVAWPGVIEAGAVIDTPVLSLDLYPTVLEAVGAAPRPEQHLDAVGLLGLLRGGPAPARAALFWHYPHYSNQGGFPGGAVRAGAWKLIERYEDGRVHLYDLATDPGELEDRAAAEPTRVAALRSQLHDWYASVDARFLRALPEGPAPWRPDREHPEGGQE